ncbi:putative HNT1-adenosine 5'-monophosphoramidase [Cladochytrium replicatum]|nr:putative HNT1-adenosine 5'-monophosphoramidase [Cladochytrium replicatum]
MSSNASCIFCKIIKGAIPSSKILETELTYVFLDINPISKAHALVIPKYHAQFMHEVPDEHLADILPIAKKVATAIGAENYNILQNNGRLAHQAVDHVHFHIIPKPDARQGLGIEWPQQSPSKEELTETLAAIKAKLESHSTL